MFSTVLHSALLLFNNERYVFYWIYGPTLNDEVWASIAIKDLKQLIQASVDVDVDVVSEFKHKPLFGFLDVSLYSIRV